ncbi:ABC transporter ATP-binding protein [uncultured Umboniibacter sp.]|uniref:ABC transporter ATP-binding protein n=1 Tax=uncultured Umboniibacter sp. TaxID=1798917 RepID=UPI0026354690|nr:ABC transporter ATP-binding protein [uncultured Umboniibacter sp.]
MIELNSITKRYESLKVLEQINLTIDSGEILALVGSSGSGKSTLLRVIAGLCEIDSGSVSIDNQIVLDKQVNVRPEVRKVGLIFQDHALFPHLNVFHNIDFSGVSSPREIESLAQQLQIQDLLERFPHELSGGQQQRVAIARSIAAKPRVLLFDEPFASLDESLKHSLLSELQQLIKARHMTAIFVTHNHREAFALADRVAFLHQGSLAQVDSPENIFMLPATEACAEFFSLGYWFTEAELMKLCTESHPAGRYFVRPDSLNLSAEIENTNEFTAAKIKSKIYLAPGFQYEIELKKLGVSSLRVNSPENLKIGQTATVSLVSQKVLPFID